jgi:2-oxoglutarate dehydrogenase complex dehydrogenase (E1) component-like enzyme
LESTRRSFNKDFLLALAADFKKHGAAAIEKVRKTQPAAYMKICALLVPREMKVEHTNAVESLSDEQLEQTIEALRAMLDQKAGDLAKVIEATAEPAALPASTTGEQPRRKRQNRLFEHVDTAVGPSERVNRKPQ